jgi:hypothetical protein
MGANGDGRAIETQRTKADPHYNWGIAHHWDGRRLREGRVNSWRPAGQANHYGYRGLWFWRPVAERVEGQAVGNPVTDRQAIGDAA